MGANDGIRSKLKKSAQEANSLSNSLWKDAWKIKKKFEKMHKTASQLGSAFGQKQTSIPNGPEAFEIFQLNLVEKKKELIEKNPNIVKWYEETKVLAEKFAEFRCLMGETEKEYVRLRNASIKAREKEQVALKMLNDYVEKKSKMKELSKEEYQKFKEGYMLAAKNL